MADETGNVNGARRRQSVIGMYKGNEGRGCSMEEEGRKSRNIVSRFISSRIKGSGMVFRTVKVLSLW